jgi:hypothetical protein
MKEIQLIGFFVNYGIALYLENIYPTVLMDEEN